MDGAHTTATAPVRRQSSEVVRGTHEVIRGTHQVIRCTHQVIRGTHQVIRGTHHVIRGTHQVIRGTHQVIRGTPGGLQGACRAAVAGRAASGSCAASGGEQQQPMHANQWAMHAIRAHLAEEIESAWGGAGGTSGGDSRRCCGGLGIHHERGRGRLGRGQQREVGVGRRS